MKTDPKIAIVCAADANYFNLLKGLIESVDPFLKRRDATLCVLDLGLDADHLEWIKNRASQIVAADWDIDFSWQNEAPGYFRAMTARPFLPKHFPGYDVYLWIDSDAWVQNDLALDIYVRAALKGKLPITPEIDRSYWTMAKRPKMFGWDQNFKAYKFCFGFRVANRLARNPILNSGVFALRHDAPHWGLWQSALTRAIQGKKKAPDISALPFKLMEQTALNFIVFADNAPVTLLPATYNWFCGKGTPMLDHKECKLVEPNEPHQEIGVVHMAGDRIHERAFCLETTQGGICETKVTFEAIKALGAG